MKEVEAFVSTFSQVDYVMIKNEFKVGKHYLTRPKTGSHPKTVVSEKFQVTKIALHQIQTKRKTD